MNRGFTLIESLVVISLLAIMTSLLVLYNRTGEKQLILIKEKAQIVSIILKAKNLSFGALVEDAGTEIVCGYGVYLEGRQYFIYRDLAGDCALSDHRYTPDVDGILTNDSFTLPVALEFSELEMNDILFQPPTPDIFFDGSLALAAKTIKLADLERTIEAEIIINHAGQINTN
ncbi:MAG: type II secretion system protein [Patescibacteria group bacterium]